MHLSTISALRRARVRNEDELLAALGAPLLAARPFQPDAVRALADQLLAYWLTGERRLVPVTSLRPKDGRTTLAVALAQALAARGERVLLVDADLRSPGVHRRLGLENVGGLAALLEGRDVRLAAAAPELAVLVAGRSREDPLELLSRPRLVHFLAAAAKSYGAIVVDTPAALRGPDHELFAALAGGALLLVRSGEDARALARMRLRLTRLHARPIATLIAHT